MTKPIFIALEGIDGSGKSTQAKLLYENCIAQSKSTHLTCEPTYHAIGKNIRQILKGDLQADIRTVAALFVADRIDHIVHPDYGMQKYLGDGEWVISDRYYFSSYAYQGAHCDLDWVIDINKICAKLLAPTCTFYIDIEPALALERIKKRKENIEIYESLENLELVRKTYSRAIEKLKKTEHVKIINGNQSEQAIAAEIWTQVQLLMK